VVAREHGAVDDVHRRRPPDRNLVSPERE